MIYKMKLTDSVDSMVFDLLETPIVDKDIEGAVDNVTLDGNQYTDYLYLKKQYMQKWTILCDEEYTRLRGFYTRQWENSEVPSYKLYYGEYAESTFAQSGEYMNFTTEGLESTLQSFAMDGQAEQTTYSGKNLLAYPYKHGTSTVDGVTFTDNGDGSITVNGTSTASTYSFWFFYENAWNYNSLSFELEAGTYTFKGLGTNNVSMACNFYFSDNTNEYLYIGQNDVTKTITQKARLNIRLVVDSGVTVNNVKIYPQIELGSTATAYEPYVGGTASPNPDYPQAISTVTGEQTVTITGKNLLNAQGGFSNKIINSAGGESANNHYALFDGFIGMLPSTQYTFSLNSSVNIIFIAEYDSTKTLITRDAKVNSSSYTFTTTATTKFARVFFNYDDSTTVTQTIIDGLNIQLELGSTATTYEPYQGQKYEINLGKNLLPATNGSETINGVVFTKNSDGSITANGTASAGINYYTNGFTYTEVQAGTYTLSDGVGSGESNDTFFTFLDGAPNFNSTWNNPAFTLSQATNLRARIVVRSGVTLNSVVFKVQLEKGSQATSYAAYFEPIELAKIGTYQDRIYKEDGKWYIEKQVGKVVLDGSEYYATIAAQSTGNTFYARTDAIDTTVGSSPVLLSNYFTQISNLWGGDNEGAQIFPLQGTHKLRFRILKTALASADVAGWKTWLASNPTTVYYALATPTDTEITDETLLAQLNAIESASLPVGTVNIYTEITAGNAMPTLEITGKNILSVETDVIPQKSVRLTLTDDGVINTCGCRRNVQLTMRETIE